MSAPAALALALAPFAQEPMDGKPVVHAPDLTGGRWLNVERPLDSWDELRGQVVLLDFWTYCCINCLHMLPVLARLEDEFADEPFLVVGVHSNKFPQEGELDNVRAAIARHGIRHPVVVDEGHSIWQRFGVRAWPTFVLVDATGNVVGGNSGEVPYERLRDAVRATLDRDRARGVLAERPLFAPSAATDTGLLRFPGKVIRHGDSLFVADTGHHRIVELGLDGATRRAFGGPEPGFEDGGAASARFREPQGLATDGTWLYVADTGNHAVRRIRLEDGSVETLAGTGEKGEGLPLPGSGLRTALRSPWDVLLDGDDLHVAMAGSHQLWTLHLADGRLERLAGSGREDLVDGPAHRAALAQPSGLALGRDRRLWFADSETSSIRWLDLEEREVHTLVGQGLFVWGHTDGPCDEAAFQHPLGVAVLDDTTLVVADTFDDALRRVDLGACRVSTWFGPRDADAPEAPALWEPGGVSVAEGLVYVADTNHHRILEVAPEGGDWRIVVGPAVLRATLDTADDDSESAGAGDAPAVPTPDDDGR